MSRIRKPTKQELRDRIEQERKKLEQHQNRMQQLAGHAFVYEYIVKSRKADDCQEEIAHLESQLNDPRG